MTAAGRRQPGHGRRAWSERASSIGSTGTRAACSWSPARTPPRSALQAQLKARRVHKRYLALVERLGDGAGRPDRGTHRSRPAGPAADGHRARRSGGHHRLPRPGAVRASGRSWSSSSSPAGRTRSGSTCRPSAIRWRATRCTPRARPVAGRRASSGCSCTRGGWSSRRRRAAGSSAPSRRCRRRSESVLERLRSDEAGVRA